ncbi:uncharacterized protein LOC115253595 [Aedes albopictus]|uniref:Uncharacterized protein n=1 Tax=Aedes albopictus TaxID=7160 RepID=A0ABM1Z4D6_AEDAL
MEVGAPAIPGLHTECDFNTFNTIFYVTANEGITDIETFLELNDQDFIRLRLKTKLIKTIQKIQKQYLNDHIIEELEEEKDPLSTSDVAPGTSGVNPYHGIVLEEIIDIDTIFTQTVSGNQIVEILKEETSPNDKLLNKINRQLCDFLTSNYGLHPSSFHKNLLAQSLVNSYPILASITPDVPQALWFHPHGRGKHRHAGRIHYHMEYLSRRSGKRVVNRPRCVQQQSLLPAVIPVPEDNIEQCFYSGLI